MGVQFPKSHEVAVIHTDRMIWGTPIDLGTPPPLGAHHKAKKKHMPCGLLTYEDSYPSKLQTKWFKNSK